MEYFLTLQKKVVRITAGVNSEFHVKVYLNNQTFYLFCASNILSLMNFIINNQKILLTNSSIHIINTKNKHYLHTPDANLSYFWKSTFHAAINIFSSLAPKSDNPEEWQGKIQSTLIKILKYICLLLCGWIFNIWR